ncbi:MAG: 30s ribosomal protein S12 methylthiotransferase accessory protein YcaO [Desulfobacterales bacterium]|nr:30s ribosomal protein S12 methylthiotransferase accessory protein YcaO [Desulfobacterales bacterium]
MNKDLNDKDPKYKKQMVKTPIDKDESYEVTISKMRSLLSKHGFDIEERSWNNPVSGIYSVHIREKSSHFIYTNGKGATREAAITSGLGEFFERISCNYLFCDYYLKKNSSFVFHPDETWLSQSSDDIKKRCLNESLWEFYGELSPEDLVDYNTDSEKICAIPFEAINTKSKVYFPVNILDNLYVSNGMAAGNSVYEARVQALSEIIERNIKFRIISNGISLPQVPYEVLEKFPNIQKSITELESHGFIIKVNDASLGGKFPVININLINKEGAVFSAYGAHPFLETSIERTLTELLQGRDLDKLNDLKKPSFDKELVQSPSNLEEHFIDSTGYILIDSISEKKDFEYSFINFEGNTKEQYEYLLNTINNEDKEIYIADYDHLGIYCCRIIIPGFSEIYPLTDLTYENKNRRALLRDKLLRIDFEDKASSKELYEFIMDEEFDYNESIYEITGVITDSKYPVSICEFLLLLSISIQEFDETLMWFEMLSLDATDPDRAKIYSCMEILLNMEKEDKNIDDYKEYLNNAYGKDFYLEVTKIISGEISVKSLFNFNIESNNYIKFIKLYERNISALIAGA